MTSPLEPPSANTFMSYMEYKVLSDFTSKVNYFRYVDDCFISTKCENFILKVFDKFNNVHKAITFNKETEVNNQLQF